MIDPKKLVEIAKEFTVLYVEDDKTVMEITQRLLSNFFGSIDTASDGQAGLDHYEVGKYDIIISDIIMPRMNGIEMSKHIKEKDKYQTIVIISAHDEAQYMTELIRHYIDLFFSTSITFFQGLNLNRKLCKAQAMSMI